MNEKNPLISFVVVTHNRPPELVLGRIIASILKQNYPRKELILVGENCIFLDEIAKGLDKAKELENFLKINIKEGKDKFCSWSLVARARNKGIDLAKGEYICCQDDDNELDSDFCKNMLETIRSNNVKATWCWRKLVYPDGKEFSGNYFPWVRDDEKRRKILYNIWKKAKIIEPNSAILKDNLFARKGSEHFSSVDPNEWLIHKDVFHHIRYRENYCHNQIMYHMTFDDLWDIDFCQSGFTAACCGKPLLTYYLGGASNTICTE